MADDPIIDAIAHPLHKQPPLQTPKGKVWVPIPTISENPARANNDWYRSPLPILSFKNDTCDAGLAHMFFIRDVKPHLLKRVKKKP